MKAAIYCRKSNDEPDKTEENKSVVRQRERSIAYAKEKGFDVDRAHIYEDDGISGKEFTNRPGLQRLLADAKRGEFSALVMSEPSRLARDAIYGPPVFADILGSGVRILYYLTKSEQKLETLGDLAALWAENVSSESEQKKASERSRDALERKAANGYNTGGVVYGYDNLPIVGRTPSGSLVKSHTDYKINPEQADVVQRIFRMYADGYGVTAIAWTMNGDPAYADESRRYFDGQRPTSPRKGTGSWAPSSIRAILYRERYRGIVPFGEFRKMYKKGTAKRVKQAEHMRTARPDLEIIDAPLWEQVQARLSTVRQIYMRDNRGHLQSNPDTSRHSGYLLSGLGRCTVCGGPIWVLSGNGGPVGKRHRVPYYICGRHHSRGTTVCTNDHRVQVPRLDEPVLAAIEASVLSPDAVVYAIEQIMRKVAERRAAQPEKPRDIAADLKKIERKIDNLVAMAAEGHEGQTPRAVLAQIKTLEQQADALRAELRQYEAPVEVETFDEAKVRRAAKAQIAQFQDVLRSNVPKARQGLRKLLHEGRLNVAPIMRGEGKSYSFHGATDVAPLLGEANALIRIAFTNLASPRGFNRNKSGLLVPFAGEAA